MLSLLLVLGALCLLVSSDRAEPGASSRSEHQDY